MSWTKQQENAINARNSSIIVSAAAGSGKTAVLTERLIQLIANPKSKVRADRIIVVTFTNDAAAELKKRLDRKLRELINDNPDNSHLIKQQVLLQNAKISTINSFCFEIIRDNVTEQGITSGFSVLDNTDNDVIKSQAMEDLINYYSENEYDKISFIYDRFCVKNIRRLTDVISNVDNFLASVTLRDKWLDNAVNEYKKDFVESIYYKTFMKNCIDTLDTAYKKAKECLNMINDVFMGVTESDQYRKTYIQTVEELEKIKWFADIFRNGRIPDKSESEKAFTFKQFVRKSKKIEYDESLRIILKNKRDDFIKLVRGVASGNEYIESDFAEAGEVTEVLAEMVRKYQDIVWEKKCAKNSISFDDGERLALEMLAETDENGFIVQSETAKRIADFYDIIMIDEHQDSNNKEDMIFKLISKNYHNNENGEAMYGDNVFLVGDVKQSIYGFRLANPRNFINTLKISEPYTKNGNSMNKKIFLNKNFRSSTEVIDFVNYVFESIMSDKCGEIEYGDEEKLYFGAEAYNDGQGKKRLAHISFINTGDDSNDEKKKTAIKDTPNPEAVFTAHKIAEMIRTGVEVTLENGEKRKCVPSDFCILVRKNKYINQYADELEKLGIPAKSSEEKGYLRSREIAVLIDLLRIISNPLSDVPMTAVMTSPMYMFSISETAYIKSLDRDKPLFTIMLGMIDGEYGDCGSELTERCRMFLESLDRFRLDSVTMTIGELISTIYDTTDFISVMQLYSDGERKRANLRILIQYAKGYEQSVAFEGTGGLSGFLRHIDRVMENGDYTQGKISASSGDYVSVMTLHRSKGLEFTFVFVAENSSEFQYDSNSVMCSSDGRIGYILYDPEIVRRYRTFQQVMLVKEEKRDTRSEEMRLLYVGLTRAKQQLFINLKYNEKLIKSVKNLTEQYISGSDITDMVCQSDRFYDWIWLCLMKHADFDEIAEHFDLISENAFLPEPSFSRRIFEYEFCDKIPDMEITEEKTVCEAEPDKALCDSMSSIIYNDYDDSLSEIPAKLSVTQITRKFKEDESFDFQLRRPKFMSETKELTGAERGTAIHTFFQYCIFENAIKNPAHEIKRISDMGYISLSQAETINTYKVSAFFRSELYSRIKNAVNTWREKKFMVAVAQLELEDGIMEKFRKSDGMIKGIIDLMFEENDGLVIVDYKSDRGISAAYLEERYRIQIQLYKSAIELTFGKRVKEAYLYSFQLEKSIKVKL
ncbi:MAG: helicase-exonuclease AddAB subunit AddA [Ruminococcus sp.]|nr:helicase-exonuclease AddAB subunit AddA [Ruminococcus sp.]